MSTYSLLKTNRTTCASSSHKPAAVTASRTVFATLSTSGLPVGSGLFLRLTDFGLRMRNAISHQTAPVNSGSVVFRSSIMARTICLWLALVFAGVYVLPCLVNLGLPFGSGMNGRFSAKIFSVDSVKLDNLVRFKKQAKFF